MANQTNFSNDPKTYEDASEVLKAISHPVRLCIVRGLCGNGGCNVTYMQECLNIPQSTISQHLSKLKAAKVIEGKRNGLEVIYNIKNPVVKDIIEVMFK